ncbi:Uncharacterised protein [Vibrio cholerae]|nr:Uncharacterised protein [Vibrio cholerae]
MTPIGLDSHLAESGIASKQARTVQPCWHPVLMY